MLNHKFLGFDIRLHPDYYHNFLSTIWLPQLKEYLLKTNIKWPHYVDPFIWPSFFYIDKTSSKKELIELLSNQKNIILNLYELGGEWSKLFIKVTLQNDMNHFYEEVLLSNLGLWNDLEKMKNIATVNKAHIPRKGLIIGVELITDKSLDSDDYWSAILDLDNNFPICPKGWGLLGYDIADRYFCTGLLNLIFPLEEKESFKNEWAGYINEYCLLKTFDDAFKFLKMVEEKVPEHKPFYIYAIFCNPNLFEF